MTTHSSVLHLILAKRPRSDTLQCSCLENPMDRGVWWAACPWGHKRVIYNLAAEQQNVYFILLLAYLVLYI